MPRPPKQGLDYFPKDVGFYNDFKIMDLLEKYGPLGVTIYEVVLTEVYRNGYYLAEPIDRVSAKVARIIGSKWVQKRLVSQVILDCGDLGLFETTLLKHGVITSVGIQRRYAAVTVRNKVNKEYYWLIDEKGQPLINVPKIPVTDAKTEVSATKTPVNDADIPQKERKENKRKQKSIGDSELSEGESPRQEAVYTLPLINGSVYSVTEDEIEKYRSLYPAIDVDKEFRKMIGWLDANPKNRKTPGGIQRFINGWMSRSQDSARPERYPDASGRNRFRNFDGRTGDLDDFAWVKNRERSPGRDKGEDKRGDQKKDL